MGATSGFKQIIRARYVILGDMGAETSVLLEKLDAFIRKYYINQLIKGALIGVGLIVSWFLAITLLEAVGKFSSDVRSALFISFVLVCGWVVFRYLVRPVIGLARLGNRLSHDEAARLVGKHFPEVSDKLLNTLQLQKLQGLTAQQNELLQASIEQKSSQMSAVRFTEAINLKANQRYLPYALPPLVILVALTLTSPSLIQQPSERLINFSKDYLPEAPFQFVLENTSLQVAQNEPLTLQVTLTGQAVPAEVYVETADGVRFKMKNSNSGFEYHFPSVSESFAFKFSGGGFSSEEYRIQALPKALLTNVQIAVKPPAYTRLPAFELQGGGNAEIPAGSEIQWVVKTRNSEKVDLLFADSVVTLTPDDRGEARLKTTLYQSLSYRIVPSNAQLGAKDTLSYSLLTRADAYPQIDVAESADSTFQMVKYFSGSLADDYGLSRLRLVYREANDTGSAPTSIPVTYQGEFRGAR